MNLEKIIFNADDLGMSAEIDKKILSAANCGFIQSASISVVNGLDGVQFKRFLNLRHPLQLGLHINLTEGRSLSSSSKTANLANSCGTFKSAIELLSNEDNLLEEMLYLEMKAQLDRFIQLSGSKPNHIDGHQHYTFLSPIAFSAFLKLATSENLKVRNPLPFSNEHRLQAFVESVKNRYGISIPFSAAKRSHELQNVFKTSQAELRTGNCLIEIPSTKDLDKALQLLETIEVVCHPHNPTDLIKLKLLYQ
jgi:predicted glycoside hydrolase/deacetylase ChbG (UPF0249 family)